MAPPKGHEVGGRGGDGRGLSSRSTCGIFLHRARRFQGHFLPRTLYTRKRSAPLRCPEPLFACPGCCGWPPLRPTSCPCVPACSHGRRDGRPLDDTEDNLTPINAAPRKYRLIRDAPGLSSCCRNDHATYILIQTVRCEKRCMLHLRASPERASQLVCECRQWNIIAASI